MYAKTKEELFSGWLKSAVVASDWEHIDIAREIFYSGLKSMFEDILVTLETYATVCEGLPSYTTTASSQYDSVHSDLTYQYEEMIKGIK